VTGLVLASRELYRHVAAQSAFVVLLCTAIAHALEPSQSLTIQAARQNWRGSLPTKVSSRRLCIGKHKHQKKATSWSMDEPCMTVVVGHLDHPVWEAESRQSEFFHLDGCPIATQLLLLSLPTATEARDRAHQCHRRQCRL